MRILSALLLCLSLVSTESKSQLRPASTTATTKKLTTKSTTTLDTSTKAMELPSSLKLLIGAGGIYGAFLYYGTLQEDVFHYKAADGTKFKSAWFLQALGNNYIILYYIYLLVLHK
jgi:UDP-galactose transporter B1